MNARTSFQVGLVIAAALSLAACDAEHAKRDAVMAGKKVENAIERTGEKIADASRTAAAEVKEAGRELKDSASNATAEARTSESGSVLSDSAITASIQTDYLKDPDLSVLKIDVDTKDGVVTLNGMASTDEAKSRAEKLAMANKGVKQVNNNLAVKQG